MCEIPPVTLEAQEIHDALVVEMLSFIILLGVGILYSINVEALSFAQSTQ